MEEFRLSKESASSLRSFSEKNGLSLNTLLQGAWSLLLHHYSDEDDVVYGATRSCRRTAIEGAERMRRLINDLLTYSRVEAQAREFGAVDMRAALEAALEYLRASIEESQAEVYVGELPTVLADEVQMKQLLSNLIANAIKFRGSASPAVDVSFSERGNELVFSVRDNGIGIEPKHLPSLFRMFQRLHTRDEYPGTGIGLAISKKIVERHGGKIWAESDGVSGSTFLFTLPKKQD